jgi:hypothetical protein
MAKPTRKKYSNRLMTIIFSVAAFLAIGGLPLMLLRNHALAVQVSLVAAACAIIPFGIRSHSLPGGVLRGAGLGLAAGSSLISALRGLIPPQDFARYAATYSLAMVALTTAVALLFAYLAQRRRRMMEDSWS